MQRLVIIGNSAAGLSAVEAIRSRDRRSRVTIIAAEAHPPYSRIMLTYLMAGKVRPDQMPLHGPDWYERMGVEALTGCRAVAIDARRQEVIAEKRSNRRGTIRVSYDQLLIATGAAAQRPDLPGIDRPGVFCLRDLDDAVAITRYIRSHRSSDRTLRAMFLGGGPVCLQALAALAERGVKVGLLVKSKAILSQLADPYTAGLAGTLLRSRGVQVATGVDVTVIDARRKPGRRGTGSPLVVVTRHGRRLPADVLIVGKGTKPNVELTRGTKIATDAGILVDETMATTVPGVFAAGDVAQATHCVSGRKVCYGTWSNACEQGRIAGLNMIGCRTEWIGGLNRTITTLFGNTLGSAGAIHVPADGSDTALTLHHYRDRSRNVSRRLAFRGGRCIGAVLWNACDDLGVLSTLISTRRDCTGWEYQLARGETASAEALRRGLIHGPSSRRACGLQRERAGH